MRRPPPLALLALVGVVGCKQAVEAPSELAELSVWLWSSFEDPEPEVLSTGLDNLWAFQQAEIELSTGWEDRGFDALDRLDRDAVDPLVDHDNDPAAAIGMGLFFPSRFSPGGHLDIIGMRDQAPVEPSSPDHYVREFVENDPGCMRERACEVLRSMNDVHRDNFLYALEYEMGKDWRWVETAEGPALLGRSWNVGENTNDSNVRLLQGYALDVFLPRGDASVRYHAVWQQTDMPGGLTDEDLTRAVLKGIDDQLTLHDDFLAGDL